MEGLRRIQGAAIGFLLCAVALIGAPIQQQQTAAIKSRVTTTPPTFTSEGHTAVDGTGASFNSSTISVTVSGSNPLLIVCWHAEFGDILNWTVTYNGVAMRLFVYTDGYHGGANNKLFRCYYMVNPPAGAHDVVVKHVTDAAGTVSTIPNELAVTALLFNNVAQVFYPFRDVDVDVSASNRTGESVTVDSHASDLVCHVIASALVTQGALGSGETQVVFANDGTDDASLLVSTKAGGASSTTVSTTGYANTFPVQGVAFSIMAAGEAETYALKQDSFVRANETPLSGGGTWTTPVGNVTVGAINLASNVATGATAVENIAKVNTPSFPNEQRARIVYTSGQYSRAWVRLQSGSGSGYFVTRESSTEVAIYKVTDNGSTLSYSKLGANFSLPFGFVAGDLLELQATGTTTTTLTAYWNQTPLGSRTDSSSPFTGGQPGCGMFFAETLGAFEASSLPVRAP